MVQKSRSRQKEIDCTLQDYFKMVYHGRARKCLKSYTNYCIKNKSDSFRYKKRN